MGLTFSWPFLMEKVYHHFAGVVSKTRRLFAYLVTKKGGLWLCPSRLERENFRGFVEVCGSGREDESKSFCKISFGGVLIAVLSHSFYLSPNPFDVLPTLVDNIARLLGCALYFDPLNSPSCLSLNF